MPTSPMSEVIQHLRSLLLPERADLTDGQLLECFVSRRESAAMEALVRRHGPMVWSVCCRVLRNHHDAEDAFQATFLVLIRKAAAIRFPTQLGSWLYGVAYKTALKARATRAKRKEREKLGSGMPEPAVTDRSLWNDLQPLLDQELSLLPEKYRTAIVLCELGGKTLKEVARHLGCPEGTVASRLARARTMLAKRLARHGLAVTSGTLAAMLSRKAASASVPASVMSSTIKVVTLVATGQAAATGIISGAAAALTEGVIKAMFLNKLMKLMGLLLVVVGLSGAAGLIYQTQATDPPKEQQVNERPQASRTEAAGKETKPAEGPDDAKRLQGAWHVVDAEKNGKPTAEDPEDERMEMTFKGDEVTVSNVAGKKIKYKYSLDTRKSPREIRMIFPDGKLKGQTWRVIYSLAKDELKLCMPLGPESAPPKEFKTKAGDKPQAGGGGVMAKAEEKYEQYRRVIDPLLETESAAKLSASAVKQDNKINIKVEVADLKNPGRNVRLRLLLVEEMVRYVGGNRVRFHRNVVRSMVGGADGFALKDKNSRHTAAVDLDVLRKSLNGYLDDYNNRRPFSNSDRPLDLANLRLIALVQDDSTREILQAAEVEVIAQGKTAPKE